MNLRDLKYLVAVADLKSFRKAAESCFISQPTLSMQLKKLEEHLQVKLIERESRNIMLTEAGKEIVEKSREILKLQNEVVSIAENHKNPYAGEIRLGAFPTLAPYYFPRIIPKITRSFPEMSIYLIEEKTEKLLEMLKNGELDAAFIALPVKDRTLSVTEIFTENFLLALPKKLNGKIKLNNRKVSISDLRNQKLLLLEEGHCLRDQALQVCKIAGMGENRTFRATSLETLRNMVSSGMGITLIPECARQANDGIDYIELKNEDNAVRSIGLIWRKGSNRDKLFEKIVKIIKN